MSSSEWKAWKQFLEETGFDIDHATKNSQNHWQYKCTNVECPYFYTNGGDHTTPQRRWKSEARKQIEKCKAWKNKQLFNVETDASKSKAAFKVTKKQRRSEHFKIYHEVKN